MRRMRMLHRGSYTRILAEEPRSSKGVRIIPGDPSAKRGPQDDSSYAEVNKRGPALAGPSLCPFPDQKRNFPRSEKELH
jgi:hypothetical protein